MEQYSNSKLSCFKEECERKYFFRYVCRLVKKGIEEPLVYGQGLHKHCDAFFDGAGVDVAIKAFKDVIGPADLDIKRSLTTGEAIVREYYSTWHSDKDFVVLEKEARHSLDFGDFEFLVVLDKIVEWPYGITAIDHKTTSSYISTYVREIHDKHQFTGYIHKLKELYPDAYGLLVDIMHIPKPNKDGGIKNRDGTTKIQLDRVLTHRTEFDIDEWKEWVRTSVDDIRRCKDKNLWRKNDRGCHDWNRECPYKMLCELQVSNDERAAFAKESIEFEVKESKIQE